MAKARSVDLLFPTAGLVRRSGYQQQAPYSTPDCLNVRPFDPLEGRERGGSRPGLKKSFATVFGGGNPIQSLASVTVADDDGTIRDVLVVVAEGIVKYTDAAEAFQSPVVETVKLDDDIGDGGFEAVAETTASVATATMTRASAVATMNCGAAHGLTVGDIVDVTGLTVTDTTFNATDAIVLSIVDADSFTYTNMGANVAVARVDAGGLVTRVTGHAFSGHWTLTAGSGAIAAETTHRHAGAYAAKLSYTAGASYLHQDFTVTAAATCTLSFWARGDGVVGGRYQIRRMTAVEADIVAIAATGVTGTTYRQVFVNFTVPAGCTTVRVYFHSPSASGDAYFDSATLSHRVPGTAAVLSTSLNTISAVGLLQKFYFSDANENVSGARGTVASNVLSDPDVANWTALGLSASTDFVAISSPVTDELFSDSRSISRLVAESAILSGGDLQEGPVVFTITRKDYSGTKMRYVGSELVDGETHLLFTDEDVTDWDAMGLTTANDCVIVFQNSTEEDTATKHVMGTNGPYLWLSTAPTDYVDGSLIAWTIGRADAIDVQGTIGSDNELTAASIADWTAFGIGDDDSIILDREESGFAGGTFPILSIAAGGVTIDGEVPDGSGYSYQIGRKIKTLDPDEGTIGVIRETKGQSPLNCSILCAYRGRLVAVFKNTWSMCRVNNPTDWDYGADDQDTNRAMAGGVAEASDVPDPVKAVIAHTDDYLIFGCPGSLWVLRGDPASGGVVDQISPEVGIVGGDAWCKLPDGTLVFLSRAGVYMLAAGGNGYPVPFSSGLVPRELRNVDAVTNVVTMQYDASDDGIHLFITPAAGTAGSHWWIDWKLKGMWPVAVPAGMQPFSMIAYAADATDAKRVLLGGVDGYIREFDDAAVADDGTAIVSYVEIGPIHLAPSGFEGIISGLTAILDEDSSSVVWEIHVATTGEAAVDSTSAKATGTWVAGWNRTPGYRVRGACGVIRVEGGASAWALETISLTVSPGGMMR